MDRLKSVLVAVDFSQCSADALAQAVRIAAWNQASISALHVVMLPSVAPAPHPFLPFDLPSEREYTEIAKRRWDRFAEDVAGREGMALSMAVGSARQEIIDRVRTDRPDLLVMGTTSDSDSHRGIGATAAGVVRKADARVLLVAQGHRGPFRSIAVCVDFSDVSLRALEHGVRMAAQDGAALHVVHVYEDPWLGAPQPEVMTANMPGFEARMREAVEARLREFCKPLDHETSALKATFHAIQLSQPWASVGSGIVSAIAEYKVDLVILGTRASWNVRDFLMGSTAERVIRDAKCSLLAIKPDKTA